MINRALLDTIAARPEVDRIAPTRSYPLVRPVRSTAARAGTNAVEWGLTNIGAPRGLDEFGDRARPGVANIDSGSSTTIRRSLSGPTGATSAAAPSTTTTTGFDWPASARRTPPATTTTTARTMGTMVGADGANQVGVALGAKWIAAKGREAQQLLGRRCWPPVSGCSP